MATVLYHNGFSGEMSKNASDHSDRVGQTLIEVWSELQVFETHRARRSYFAGDNTHHVLTVLLDEIDGVKKFLFMYDDAEQESIAPVDVLPSDSDLELMLANF